MCNFFRHTVLSKTDQPSLKGAEIPCTDGFVSAGDDQYPCQNVNLLSRVGLEELTSVQGDLGDERANDIWGWTSPSGQEIAMIGLKSGTSFVNITDPVNPLFLGSLPGRGKPTIWRDIKTYENHAYIVSENKGHGLQVSTLKRSS